MYLAVGVSLFGAPDLPPPTLLHTVWIHNPVLIHTGKGGGVNQWEGYRGASSQEGLKIPTWLTESPVYKLY